MSLEQRVIERVVGVGTIKLLSSDRSHPVLNLPGMEKAKDVAALIDDLHRKETPPPRAAYRVDLDTWPGRSVALSLLASSCGPHFPQRRPR